MYKIQLPTSPNTEFSVAPQDLSFTFRFRYLSTGITLVSISTADETIVESVRVIANEWLIPYPYMEKTRGNFRIESEEEEYPEFGGFNDSFILRYYTQEEVDKIRASET